MAAIAAYIEAMDLHRIWQHFAIVIGGLPHSGLLLATLAAILLGVAGSFALRPAPGIGRLMRSVSTVALAGILILVVLQLSRFDPSLDMAIPELGMPKQEVEGGETRIPLAPDGHYWVRARLNGAPAAFMIDTGASITTVNTDTAAAARLEPRRGGIPVIMQTANGAAAAEIATIDSLRFGNVDARGLDVAIAPNLGPTNVIGMNLLSRLGSWRVEHGVMILQPDAAQQAPADKGD
jgi:aspartyl protease family protein